MRILWRFTGFVAQNGFNWVTLRDSYNAVLVTRKIVVVQAQISRSRYVSFLHKHTQLTSITTDHPFHSIWTSSAPNCKIFARSMACPRVVSRKYSSTAWWRKALELSSAHYPARQTARSKTKNQRKRRQNQRKRARSATSSTLASSFPHMHMPTSMRMLSKRTIMSAYIAGRMISAVRSAWARPSTISHVWSVSLVIPTLMSGSRSQRFNRSWRTIRKSADCK